MWGYTRTHARAITHARTHALFLSPSLPPPRAGHFTAAAPSWHFGDAACRGAPSWQLLLHGTSGGLESRRREADGEGGREGGRWAGRTDTNRRLDARLEAFKERGVGRKRRARTRARAHARTHTRASERERERETSTRLGGSGPGIVGKVMSKKQRSHAHAHERASERKKRAHGQVDRALERGMRKRPAGRGTWTHDMSALVSRGAWLRSNTWRGTHLITGQLI